MTATVSWTENKVIKLDFDTPWNWKDYQTADETIDMMADLAHETVSLIVDLRKAPQTSTLIEHLQRSLDSRPANVCRVVIVGTPIMLEMLRRAFNYESAAIHLIEFASSMDEAERLLDPAPHEACTD